MRTQVVVQLQSNALCRFNVWHTLLSKSEKKKYWDSKSAALRGSCVIIICLSKNRCTSHLRTVAMIAMCLPDLQLVGPSASAHLRGTFAVREWPCDFSLLRLSWPLDPTSCLLRLICSEDLNLMSHLRSDNLRNTACVSPHNFVVFRLDSF